MLDSSALIPGMQGQAKGHHIHRWCEKHCSDPDLNKDEHTVNHAGDAERQAAVVVG